MIKAKAKKDIDLEICRSLGLCEEVEKKETIDGKQRTFTVEKYRTADGKLHDGIKEGDEVEFEKEVLWRHGVYDQESFQENLGELFVEPKGLTKSKPEAKNVEAKEIKVAREIAKIEEGAAEEIETVAEKEAKKTKG